MTRFFLVIFCSVVHLISLAQNPKTVWQFPAKTISIPCDSSCTTITATVPNIRQSDDYLVQAIPYQPFLYADGGTELSALYADDIYSSSIELPFPQRFFGSTYNSLVVGSNGVVSFDVTNAGKRNNFRLTTSFFNLTPVAIPYAGGTQNSLASTYYPKAAIMGVYHDIFPFDNGSRRIEWRIEGETPKRRFVASFKDVPMYGCTSISATHQIILYESTGIVEVYIQDKPVCPNWNEGLAILGMQNFARDKAVFPTGKNAGKWGEMNMNEAYRFTPSSGASQFKKAQLLLNNEVVALADTATDAEGNLSLKFSTICPTADSTQYLLRVFYTSFSDPAQEVSFDDTINVKKEAYSIDLKTQDPTCTLGGSITVQASGTPGSLLYSLNGGPKQTSNVFSDLKEGNYTITVSSNSACIKTATASLTLQDDLLLVTQPSAIICSGDEVLPQVLSNGTSFNWTPSTGLNNATLAHPQIKPKTSTTYTLTTKKGTCEKKDSIAITVKPLPVVNAGPDQTILEGEETVLSATVSSGTVTWSPSTGLSSATTLTPSASPSVTTSYILRADLNGCTATDIITVTVVPYCIKPMEAFTPNGDGINDRWLVTNGSCLQMARVEVFNRYGALVYQNNDYKNNWNGTYNGRPLPDGTYYYLITFRLINGKLVNTKGNVTILR